MSEAALPLQNMRPVPHRVDVADSQSAILSFLKDAFLSGPCALAILVEIRGGAARSLGSMVAIDHSGGYCGYVSGGCVEAAVAAEALSAIEKGEDRYVLYGEGSEFFDIVLPCGGGLTIAIHVVRDIAWIDEALGLLEARQPASLCYSGHQQSIALVSGAVPLGWQKNMDFIIALKPALRLVISGDGLEAKALEKLAIASGYSVDFDSGFEALDHWSAVVFLRHDIEAELKPMVRALRSDACYIGALGSRKTHEKRVASLSQAGVSKAEINRIHAPIGLFGPTRHSSALALSILSEIASLEGTKW